MVFCEGIYLSNVPVNGIIEFCNSISSIFLCLFSIIPIEIKISTSLYMKRASLFICGIGSILYHATMKNKWKLFDEIPMIMITTFTILNILKNNRKNIKKFFVYILLIYILIFYFFFVVWFDIISTYELENDKVSSFYVLVFRILFVLPFVLLLIYYLIYYYWNSMLFSVDEKSIYKNTLIYGIFACICWLLDMHYCSYILSLFRLHSLWHIFIGFTGYNLLCLGILINKSNKNIILIEWKFKIIPLIKKNLELEENSECII